MGRAWVKDRKKDTYYRRAKEEGYPSRAAFKLREANQRFRLLRAGDDVVDLGAAPGGWSMVASKAVGKSGRVIAIDRISMKPLEGVTFLKGDLQEEAAITALIEAIPDGADVVLSDMAPRLSGSKSLDHSRSIELAQTAMSIARRCLKAGGNLVVKVFQGDQLEAFRRGVSREFRMCKAFFPRASPARSSEVYLVAKGWKGREHSPEPL